jgi:radical SAM protein with 4Fe4S-binding SPASM domain
VGEKIAVSTLRLRETQLGLLPTVGPQSIGIVLTNACNLNCITCWSYSPLKRELPTVNWRRKHLTREILAPFFAEVATLGTERVIFTGGGDPLAHPEFYDICQDAKQAGLKVTLISNLTLVRDPKRFVSLGIDTILANFSGGDTETYIAFHPGRKLKDFNILCELLQNISKTKTQLKLVFVVCSINYHAMHDALEIAQALGASVQFKCVSTIEETQVLALTPAHKETLCAQREQLEASPVSVNWPVFWAELAGEDSHWGAAIEETGCYAGHYYSRVTASGDVYFCCNQHPTLRAGSLLEDSFTTLWQSTNYQEMRTRLRRGEFVSGCEQCGKFDLNTKVREQLRTLQKSPTGLNLRQGGVSEDNWKIPPNDLRSKIS